jgi:hypothetical protein
MEVFDIAGKTWQVSEVVQQRDVLLVLGKLMEECGELAEEVLKKKGFKKGEEGRDGIIGEAVDVITVALDIIYLSYPGKEEARRSLLNWFVKHKLKKWEQKKRIT